MKMLWDPQHTLNLRPGGQADWTCAGVCYPDVETGPEGGEVHDEYASPRLPPTPATPETGFPRCTRRLRPAEINKMARLLGEISHQMPDQVEYNVLLHLARASLCVEQPGPHQGRQEASVIYEWTRLMSVAAEELRAGQPSTTTSTPTSTSTAADSEAITTPTTTSTSTSTDSESINTPTTTTSRNEPITTPTTTTPTTPTTGSAPEPTRPRRRPQPIVTHRRHHSLSNTAIAAGTPKVVLVSVPPAPPHSVLLPSHSLPLSYSLPPSPPDSATTPFPPFSDLLLPLHHPSSAAAAAAVTQRSPTAPVKAPNDNHNHNSRNHSQHTTNPPATAPVPSVRCHRRPRSEIVSLLQPLHTALETNQLPTAPGGGVAGLGLLGLSELHEYNRLLKETQARQEVVLRQTALLRRELEALRVVRRQVEEEEEEEEAAAAVGARERAGGKDEAEVVVTGTESDKVPDTACSPLTGVYITCVYAGEKPR